MELLGCLKKLGPIATNQQEFSEFSKLPYKYVGLFFTASWCPSCVLLKPKLPQLLNNVNHRGQFFNIVALPIKDPQSSSFIFKRGQPSPFLRFKIGFDEGWHTVASFLSVRSLPSIVVITPEGKIVSRNGVNDMMRYQKQTIDYWDSLAAQN